MSAAPNVQGAVARRGALRRELGATFALSWPLVLANLAINVMPAINAAMLGRLSPRALAAGALAFNLLQPSLVLGVGVVAALSPIAAAKIGAGADRDGLRRATHQALLSALLIAAAAWIALWRTQSILVALGEPQDLAEEAAAFMRGFQWGLAPTLMFFAGRSVFAALERPRPTLVAGLVAAGFNVLANDALVFGKFGMPALGVFGSGLATTLSETLMFLILVAASLIDPRMRALRLFALPWSPARRELAALWRLGLPIGATIVAEVGVFNAATLVMGLIGPVALAGHAIALQIASLAFMVPLGLGQAATVRVGLAFGARDATRIARAGWSAFGLTAAFALFSATTMIAAPRLLIAPFIDVTAPENAATVGTAAQGRGDLPDFRREPDGARQHAARPARFALAARHRARRLLGDRRADRRRARLRRRARPRRRVDRARLRAGGCGRTADDPLARQGTAGFSAPRRRLRR